MALTKTRRKPLPIPRQALRITEAGDVLGISPKAVYRLVEVGLLGYVRLAGGSLRIPVAEIDRYLASATREPPKRRPAANAGADEQRAV